MIHPLLFTSKKRVKTINTQEEFNNIFIEENDSFQINGTFYGSITIDKDNVTVNGGTIRGSEVLNGFTDEGNGIYSKIIAEPLWIYIDGQDAKLSEYSIPINITSIPTGVNNNQLQVNSLDLIGVDVVNAKCIYIPNIWAYSTEFKVLSETSGLLTLNKPHSAEIYPPQIGDQLLFFNKLEYITNDYDYAYENGKLYIKLPLNPNNYVINAVYKESGISIAANNVTIKNVEIKEFFKSGIYCSLSESLTIVNNNIHHIREDGIQIIFNSYVNNINDNVIYNCGTAGIRQTTSNNSTIKSNTIYNIGTQSTKGWLRDYVTSSRNIVGAGIIWGSHNESLPLLTSEFNNISLNTIYNTAYNGIHSSKGRNTIIEKNIISNVVNRLSDGGAIYTFYYRQSYPELASNIIIRNNFISDCDGAASVIYLDNRTFNSEVYNNTIYQSNTRGIMCNADTEQNNIHNNTIFRCNSGIWYRDWSAPDKILSNDKNINEDNIIVCGATSQYSIETDDGVSPYINGGNADRNYYINPYGLNVANINNVASNLATLRSTYSRDVNSIGLTNYITAPGDPNNEILLITNPSGNSIIGNAPIGIWKDKNGNVITEYTVLAWGSLVLLKNLP